MKQNEGDEGNILLRVLVAKNERSEWEEPLKVTIAREVLKGRDSAELR
jgi:hypothetical protein